MEHWIRFEKLIIDGNLSKMTKTIGNLKEDINSIITPSNQNLLHIAVYNTNNIAIIEEIIKSGININAKTEKGDTCLHCFVYRLTNSYSPLNQVQTNIFRLLISKGADLNIENCYGNPPFYYATGALVTTDRGSIELVNFLLEYPIKNKAIIKSLKIFDSINLDNVKNESRKEKIIELKQLLESSI